MAVGDATTRSRRQGRWRAHRWLLIPTLPALLIRLWFVIQQPRTLRGDPYYFHSQANLLVQGHGFALPLFSLGSRIVPAADHPPLFTAWLGLWSAVGLDSIRWHLVAGAVIATLTVPLVAATAALVAGRVAGAAAGALAAIWPNLVYFSVSGYSEAAAMTCVAWFSFLAVRYLKAPSMGRLAAVGAAAALAGLARSELILLLGAVVPLVMVTSPLDRLAKARWAGVAVLTAAVLVAPWALYNQSRFDRPVPLSTGLGLILVGTNCDNVYYGPYIGYWSFACQVSGQNAARSFDGSDPSEIDPRLRAVGVRYAMEHRSRLPAVITARVTRMFGLYRARGSVRLARNAEATPEWVAAAVTSTWWMAMALGLAGAVSMRRRSEHLTPFVTPVVVIAITAIVSYGFPRFRAPIEPAVLVLSGIAIARLLERRLNRRMRLPRR